MLSNWPKVTCEHAGGYNALPYYAAGHMSICSRCGCCDGAARVQHALLRLPHVACRPARRVSPSASVRLCAQPKVVPVGLSVSRPAVPVHAGARVCCCVYCTPRSSNLQGSRGEISRGPLFRLSFAVSRISPHFRPVTASVADADCGFSAPPASTPARPSPEARSRTAAARARGPRPEAQAERG
jgi:hypothetical protein